MRLLITCEELKSLVKKQLSNLLMFSPKSEGETINLAIDKSLERVNYCISHSTCKYYTKDNETVFSPFHSGQYTIFLYFLANTLYNTFKQPDLAERVYYLNKILNSVDLYYEVELPAIFDLDHQIGTVIGRGKFSNYFFFSQNCNVGNNKGIYPTFAENIIMLPGSAVVGNSHIGKNCIISSRTYIKDQDIPDNSIVFGNSPDLKILTKSELYIRNNFKKWIFEK